MSNPLEKERLGKWVQATRGENLSLDKREFLPPRAAVGLWNRVFGGENRVHCQILTNELVGDSYTILSVEREMFGVVTTPELFSWRINWRDVDGVPRMDRFKGSTRMRVKEIENGGSKSIVVFDSLRGSDVIWIFTPKNN